MSQKEEKYVSKLDIFSINDESYVYDKKSKFKSIPSKGLEGFINVFLVLHICVFAIRKNK